MLRALSSPNDQEVEIAQIYLHHRPIADETELRDVATSVTRTLVPNARLLWAAVSKFRLNEEPLAVFPELYE